MITTTDRAQRTSADGRVRYAVVGLGWIAQVAVLPAFTNAKSNSRLAALVSSDETKLKKLGRKYGVQHLYAYEQYDECLASGEIDAVYIALPNHMHREYAVRAADAGIDVLCEKPLAVNEQECREMIDAAGRNQIKLMTAYRLHFEPANMSAVEIVGSGQLGEVRAFHSIFSMKVEDMDNIRLQKDKGGGTVFDIGIYCINAARYLFQDEPTEVFAYSAPLNRTNPNGVDEMTSAVLRFPGDRLASFTSSFGVADVSAYRILGSEGDLCVEPAYQFEDHLWHELTLNGRTKRTRFRKHDQFAPLIMHFSDCVLSGADPEPSGEEGLADVRIINALYESAARSEPVSLKELAAAGIGAVRRRPGPEQVMKPSKPRVPRLVHARAPGG